MRIYIIGGAGNGKSTAANKISALTRIPMIDLDNIAYLGGGGPDWSSPERHVEIERILALPSWIVEGVYTGWTQPFLDSAHVVVWLDIPWRVAAWRIVKRHFIRNIRGDNKYPGTCRLVRFLRDVRGYYIGRDLAQARRSDSNRTDRAETIRFLRGHESKTLVCRNGRDFDAVLHRLRWSIRPVHSGDTSGD